MCRVLLFVLCGLVASGVSAREADPMNAVAERYAHLVLALGQHDPDYVDSFYGPDEWKTQAEKEKKSLDQITAEATTLSASVNQDQPSRQSSPKGRGGQETSRDSGDELVKLRREYLQKQISALAARVSI